MYYREKARYIYLDRANSWYRQVLLQSHDCFFRTLLLIFVADFCAYLISKGVSYCVAVGTFAEYSFLFRFVTVSSNFGCWLEFN